MLRRTVGSRTLEEVLVSAQGLATGIGQADISAIDWVTFHFGSGNVDYGIFKMWGVK